MVTKSKIKIGFLIFICFAGFIVIIISKPLLSSCNYNCIPEEDKSYFMIKSANGDNSSPVIVFIKPDNNDTIITRNYYDIIVNVTDDTPPLMGNVSIEISNTTISLFNASMIKDEGDQWFFIWSNITSYPNELTYTFQVIAKDSSSNENVGMSGLISVYVDIYSSRNPGFINGIIYVIVASLLIAGILVYFNRKKAFLTPSRN
ncbi:MAG: hypothetical protein KGD58_10665 [Candidatus Lokiarchaeota archaeon]|nr:hypothetical protein [Candidatus Lokiarchaeota archaeon]